VVISAVEGGKLPRNWRWRTLGEALPLEYGRALPARSRSDNGETVVYGSSGPVGTHSGDFLPGPAVIVGRKGSAGAVHYCRGACWPIDTAYFVALAADVDAKYAFYLLRWLRLDKLDQSTAIPSLSRDAYRDVQAPFPDLESQQAIVARVDELFSELDEGEEELRRAQGALENYRKSLLKVAMTGKLTADWRAANPPQESGAELLRGLLEERCTIWKAEPKNRGKRYAEPAGADETNLPDLPNGWAWATVRQIAEFLTSGSRGWSKFYADSGALFIRAQDINRDVLDLTQVAHVALPTGTEGMRSRVRQGDLLVTITGANVTKTAHVDRQIDEAYVSQHVALLRLSQRISSEFAWLWLVTPTGGRKQLEKAAYGAGKPGLNLPNILDVAIPLPPRQEQEEIYERVSGHLGTAAAILREAHQSSELSTLRQSILAAAFRGELIA
jgi:type I restriction enzyme S subunit